MKIAIVGDVGIDYYENQDLLKPGGIAFNFAYNLCALKASKVSLVGILGNDKHSSQLMLLLKKEGVDCSHIQITKGYAPKQNIFLKNGERKFTGYSAGVLTKWKLRKEDRDFIRKTEVVYVPLSDGMEHIFNTIKKIKGPLKAVDFSQDYEFADFDKKENVITKNAKYFDVIFVGGEKKHQKIVMPLAKKYPGKVFILTLGKKGCIAFYCGSKFFQPSKKCKVVDTTGAGDAFQAGFLASWILKSDITTALKKGTIQATRAIKHIGSTRLIFISH